ncbi:hypothetical protein MRU69_02715 [Kocuria flava]|uniref:pentapeptide repeat-containing protein n=1 Tax=Kocuria flava TaxID=446860 RepID=UPI001FF45B5A|nr:hypothetical protein [Kocuria flava]MCJ8503778.1 hypothetical protein [Kocuria flava]
MERMARRTTPASPRIRALELPDPEAGSGTPLRPFATYEALAFTGDDLTGTELTDVGFSACSFAELNAHELELTGTRLTDCRLSRLDVPTVTAACAALRHSLLERSRLGVLQCVEGTWDAVHVRGCKVGYLSLRGADARDVLFEDCVIGELDLAGARVERMAFPGSEVAALDVTGAALADVDLRGVDLPEITGPGDLRGTTVDALQLQLLAPQLAAHLGIDVEA